MFLKIEGGRKRESDAMMEAERCYAAGFEDGEKWSQDNKKFRQPLETGENKVTDCSLGLPERNAALLTLDFSSLRPMLS